MQKLLVSLSLCVIIAAYVEGSGYLLTPPARGSAWRAGFPTPVDKNDNAMSCGGRGILHNKVNRGMCGVCGEAYSNANKRLEPGPANQYATGTIVGNYQQGETIDVTIVTTAFQQGYYEFRLCENNVPQQGKDSSIAVTPECLNKNLLKSAKTGSTEFIASPGKSTHRVMLPAHVSCSACVLQWRYRFGNNWGCDNDLCGLGMGPQEEYYGCSDIAITPPMSSTLPATTTDSSANYTVPANTTNDGATNNTNVYEMSTTKIQTQTFTMTMPQKITKHQVTKPQVTASKVTTPKVTTPKVTTPQVTTPKVTTPQVTTPKVTTPQVTTPKVTTPKVTTPQVTTPKVTTPQTVKPVTKKPAPKPVTRKPAPKRRVCGGVGIYARSHARYCHLNCNHNPPHCPPSHCRCRWV